MHRSSYEKMRAFRETYLRAREGRGTEILDVGSASFAEDDGYRPLFDDSAWRYRGLDLAPARNVDVVAASPYDWSDVADESVDVVVSGQAFEHIAWPWLTMMEIARVLRPKGIAAITAPSAGHVHRYPLDCWRYNPDGFPALAAYAGLSLVEQHTDRGYAFPENAFWGDVFVVLRKPRRSAEEQDAWRRRHTAARESVRGLDSAGTPAVEPGLAAIERKTADELKLVDAKRVKAELIKQSLGRAWKIFRTPMGRLERQ